MLATPREHLPEGFPLPKEAESRKFEKIWERAFEIHATAHDFSYPAQHGFGDKPREGILATSEDDPTYCDCYERAYQEFLIAYKIGRRIFERPQAPILFIETRRHIRLEA